MDVIIEKWEGHLTPKELSQYADKNSHGSNTTVLGKAAQCAYLALTHANALLPKDVDRMLDICKQQVQTCV